MNSDQFEWQMARAKDHASVFVGKDGVPDTVMVGLLANHMRSLATQNESNGDSTRRDECLRVALMLDMYSSKESRLAMSSSDVDKILSPKKAAGETAGNWGLSTDTEWAIDELAAEGRLRLSMGRWGASGLPLVKPFDANWVASMCATNVSPEYLDMLRLPWPSFAIACPPGTGLRFGLSDPRPETARLPGDRKGLNEDSEVSVVYVTAVIPELGEKVLADRPELYDGRERWLHIQSYTPGQWKRAAYMFRKMSELGDDLTTSELDREEAQYLRCQKMVSKLVAGVLMAMHAGQFRTTSGGKKRAARRGALPSCTEFAVGVPVRVRTVDFVREYVSKGPRKMLGPRTLQTLVRGHWKNQPYGTGSTSRKFIHVEPYWRGPDDAPIAVRPHILWKKSEAAE